LSGLAPGSNYKYRIAGEQAWRRFRTPPALGQPIDFGVVADLGQTNNSAATMASMAEKVADGSIDSILFPGDLSYADGVGARWDSFARLAEPLFSASVTSYAGGNHEVDTGMENWIHFENRYPELFLSQDSKSTHHLYYSFEAGLAHVVTLCSYCPVHEGSSQRRWLEKDLASVDRARTPWLLLQWHTPWYTSNGHHSMKEGTDMREALEDIIHQAGADIVFNGHVHAYERTSPIYKNETVSCGGTVYITVGDGGNREEFATPWVTPETPAPPLYDQPEWSLRREFAYGHGTFRLYNATHAEWLWFQNGETHAEASDSAVLQKAPCAASETVV
jgi:3',5'-cyclic AMP phosphodiesterase CpdA